MEIQQALAASTICRYIDDEHVTLIQNAGEIRSLAAGERLFEENDEGGSLFVILSGKISIQKKMADGSQKELAALTSGDIIGELSLVDASPRSAAAAATADCQLFELSRRDIMGVIRSEPTAAARVLWAVLETVSLRLRDMDEELVKWNVTGEIPKAEF